MKTLKITTGNRQYSVLTGRGIIKQLPNSIYKWKQPRGILVIIDKKVSELHKEKISDLVTGINEKISIYRIAASEKNKTLKECEKIFQFLNMNNFGRDALIVAIGGGITGDVAGFVASTYMRGIPLIHVPTTLISAIDSSIGGKTGVNFSNIKNNIGTFYPPTMVFTDTSFLETLDAKEIRSGMGEVIKYGIIGGNDFLSLIEKEFFALLDLEPRIIDETVGRCIRIKKSIVEADEHEKSLRKVLNLGHTFGHALESATQYRLSHGESVAAGILCSSIIAKNRKILPRDKFERLTKLPLLLLSKTKSGFPDGKEILSFMESDKKKRAGKNMLVIPAEAGKIIIDFETKDSEIQKAFEEFRTIIGKKEKSI